MDRRWPTCPLCPYTLCMLHLISKFSGTVSFLRDIFLSKETMVYAYSLSESLLLDNNFYKVLESWKQSQKLSVSAIQDILTPPESRDKSQIPVF